MEAATLTPPAWLESAVRLATPPLAREAVLGDLCETYQSPRQYARDALGIVPFVIASQLRRHLNLPALLLQAALVGACFGMTAAIAAAPLLMLRDAWQPAARPSPVWALRQAVLAAFVGLVMLQLSFAASHHAWPRDTGSALLWVELLFVGPALLPLLGLLRTGLIVHGDRGASEMPRDGLSAQELAQAISLCSRRARLQQRLEAVALAISAACMIHDSPMLAGCFAVAALYLLADSAARAPMAGDFISLRAAFARQLSRRQQLRRFLWWLWLAPLLLTLQSRYVQGGLANGHTMHVIAGVGAITLLCFLAAALSSEQGGRTQERIGGLEHMREKIA